MLYSLFNRLYNASMLSSSAIRNRLSISSITVTLVLPQISLCSTMNGHTLSYSQFYPFRTFWQMKRRGFHQAANIMSSKRKLVAEGHSIPALRVLLFFDGCVGRSYCTEMFVTLTPHPTKLSAIAAVAITANTICFFIYLFLPYYKRHCFSKSKLVEECFPLRVAGCL